ncbi:MAG: ABC transporter ATP-binding protein [Desulfurococcus sp.]|jgi:ABC-type multidrug transport system ATPase subunit|uniref:ABC transporter ATP-binding protein n=2 Tax=Desulfurococcus sp. TaxID=51678 RepID=UPI0031669DE7
MHDEKNPMFSVRNLLVKYHKLVALEVEELEAPVGKILIVGSNGSGKTTLIKVLLGLMRPTRGEVRLLGLNPFTESNKLAKQVTYVRDKDELPDNLKLSTLLNVLREQYGEDNVDAIAKELGLLNHKDKRLCELSRGWRRKASLLIALASNKKLIIMDEPFSGIDSGSRALISELLEKKPSNMIIISHIQSRIRFDHLIVVESGRITYNGPYKPIEWYS